MLLQWAFWIQQVLVIHIEDRRKDHWQMLSHHFITIALIAASYAYHQTRVGNLILVLMDVVDLVFPVSQPHARHTIDLLLTPNSLLNVSNISASLLSAMFYSACSSPCGFSHATCSIL